MPGKFSLASILQLRTLVAEQEERTLMRLQAELATLQTARDRTVDEMAQTARAREATLLASGGLSAMHLHAFYESESALRSRLGQIDEQIRTFRDLRERQLRIWESARQKQDVLESLRDGEAVRRRVEENRTEQKAAEENFLMRARFREAAQTRQSLPGKQ